MMGLSATRDSPTYWFRGHMWGCGVEEIMWGCVEWKMAWGQGY